MTKAIPFLLQGKNIILVVDGKSHNISRDTHIAYDKIVEALKAEDWELLKDLVEPKKIIVNFSGGNVTINGDELLWKGQPFHNSIASRMIEMFKEGFPIEPMVKFMENLMMNPSKRSVDQLYGFLEKNSLPITQDGHFLAFKRVRSDYLDVHSGTIDNGVGQVVEMERNAVDDDPQSTCSSGLHFCSESYLTHFGGRNDPVMILKINPADVVSIPVDYNGAKGRCSKYEVVGEVGADTTPAEAFVSVVNDDYQTKSVTPGWPFPVGNQSDADEEVLYDLVRVNGGQVEYFGVSKADAEHIIQKNETQKKAKLKMVISR